MTAHVKRVIANAALAAGVLMALAAAAASAGMIASATAQTNNVDGEFCAPAETLMQKANEFFHEHVQWTGKNKMGYRFVLMASDNTWTFLMINNKASEDGTFEACVKASDGQGPADEGDHS